MKKSSLVFLAPLLVSTLLSCAGNTDPAPEPWRTCGHDVNDSKNYKFLQPNGGEKYRVNQIIALLICSTDPTLRAVSSSLKEFSPDSMETWIDITDSTIFLNDTVYWRIPSAIQTAGGEISCISSRCFLRIADYYYSYDQDTTDGAFSIGS